MSSSVARKKNMHSFFGKDGASCGEIINTVTRGQTSRTEQLDRDRTGNEKEFDGSKGEEGSCFSFGVALFKVRLNMKDRLVQNVRAHIVKTDRPHHKWGDLGFCHSTRFGLNAAL